MKQASIIQAFMLQAKEIKPISEIAKDTGLSISYLTELANGRKPNPPIKTILKISACVGANLEITFPAVDLIGCQTHQEAV